MGEKVGGGRLGGHFVLWTLRKMRKIENNKEKECKGVIKTEDHSEEQAP